MGGAVIEEFHPRGIVCVVKKRHRPADQGDRRFVEPAVKGYGPVLVYLAHHPFSEVVREVFRGFPDQVEVFRVPGKGRLFRASMLAGMVFVNPLPELCVQLVKGEPVRYGGEELQPDGLEEFFHLAPSFGLVWLWIRAIPREAHAWRRIWVEKAGPLST